MLGKKGASARKLNNCRNSMEQLSVAEGKLGSVMTRLLGVDIFNKKLEMDEERWKPILPVQSISLETLGLSLRDLDTRPTSLRRSRRRRKMTLTAVPKRRRWQKNIITFPDLVDKQAQLTVPWQIPKKQSRQIGQPWPFFLFRCQREVTWRGSPTWSWTRRAGASVEAGNVDRGCQWPLHMSMTCPCCQSCQVSKNSLSPCCLVSCHCQGHRGPPSDYFPSIFIPFYWPLSVPCDTCQNVIVLSKVTKTTVI